ncbi:universal stress protein [Shimia abyssi]|uniref:Nucleotide-binding universal stress UspA family protein n=1 Tax=Shimia abyssi TaxID=1662395 RepID=A0A2P8F8S8_9RHOB|nr:universal stress protein [Shimia abyssi]PSL18108.1 nucleotide-binding universal stress UspA family protein [Shimia abyssi]
MHKHILIPVALDHEDLVQRKITTARKVLDDGGRITLLTILESIPGFVNEFVTIKESNHLSNRVKRALETAAGDASDILTQVTSGKPGVEVAEFARANAVDLIIIGSHSPHAKGYALGSTAARVARRAPCSVLILR